jgi:hypothetical protein
MMSSVVKATPAASIEIQLGSHPESHYGPALGGKGLGKGEVELVDAMVISHPIRALTSNGEGS